MPKKAILFEQQNETINEDMNMQPINDSKNENFTNSIISRHKSYSNFEFRRGALQEPPPQNAAHLQNQDFACRQRREYSLIKKSKILSNASKPSRLKFFMTEIRDQMKDIVFRENVFRILVLLSLLIEVVLIILYLYEASTVTLILGNDDRLSNVSNSSFMKKLFYITREIVFWRVLFAFAVILFFFRLFGLLISTWTTQDGLLIIIDLITVVPLLLTSVHSVGPYIYIPYFLRCWAFTFQLRTYFRFSRHVIDQIADNVSESLVFYTCVLVSLLLSGACSLQSADLFWAENNASLFDSFYFLVITLSTVGYGDVTPKSYQAKIFVIIVIITGIVMLPSLIAGIVEMYQLRKRGTLSYRKESDFIIVYGAFNDASFVSDILYSFIHSSSYSSSSSLLKKSYKVLLMSSKEIPGKVANLLKSQVFRGKAIFIQGSMLKRKDLFRVNARNAAAIFVTSTSNSDYGGDTEAIDFFNANERTYHLNRAIDEENMLRLWSARFFAPETPLFITNQLAESSLRQKLLVQGSLCVDELKLAIMAYNCLYRGTSTLLTNLLHSSCNGSTSLSILKRRKHWSYAWEEQYHDGLLNEIFVQKVASYFVGHSFTEMAWVVYREFQIIAFAVRTLLSDSNINHIFLNPGSGFILEKDDEIFYIAQTFAEVEDIVKMPVACLQIDQKEKDMMTSNSAGSQFIGSKESIISISRIHYPDWQSKKVIIGVPKPPYNDAQTQQCYLVSQKSSLLENVIIKDTYLKDESMGHILVLSPNYDLFMFICSLRSSHLNYSECKKIIILNGKEPTLDEWKHLSQFPDILIKIGHCRSNYDLIKAGVVNADRVVIISHPSDFDAEGIVDTSSVMASHQISSLIVGQESHFRITTEVVGRKSVKYLAPISMNSADVDFEYAPVYASGNAIVTNVLGTVIFQKVYNPYILDLLRLLLSIRTEAEFNIEIHSNIQTNYLCLIDIPSEFSSKKFIDFFYFLLVRKTILIIGLYRKGEGDSPPFVYTNPLPGTVLRATDLAYVLKYGIE